MEVQVTDLWGNITEEARTTDPVTSHQAAKLPFRRASQRHELLKTYARREALRGSGEGLTDEEAAAFTHITKGCPWKRCSELREAGLIVATDETRPSLGGATQRVCVITTLGYEALAQLREGA